jgi:hypothetical protein
LCPAHKKTSGYTFWYFTEASMVFNLDPGVKITEAFLMDRKHTGSYILRQNFGQPNFRP